MIASLYDCNVWNFEAFGKDHDDMIVRDNSTSIQDHRLGVCTWDLAKARWFSYEVTEITVGPGIHRIVGPQSVRPSVIST
jgi:hypothetical protein